MPSPTTQQALRVLSATVFLDLLGFGLILPHLPYYAKACGADGTVVGAIAASYSLLQFLFAPVWGRLSDRVGRRPPIVMGLFGSGVSFILFGGAFHTHRWTGLGLIPILFVARSVTGLFNANLSTAQAYVADMLPPEERAGGMGMIGAAFGLGFVLGPAVSAALGQVGGPDSPFYVAGVLCLATGVAAVFVLPESKTGASPGERPAPPSPAQPRPAPSRPVSPRLVSLSPAGDSRGLLGPQCWIEQVAESHDDLDARDWPRSPGLSPGRVQPFLAPCAQVGLG